MVGARVGPYRVLAKLGEGGMGSVWLAEHSILGRQAAIKILHPQFSHQAEIVARFFNEARAATATADPGIVQVFDFGQLDDGNAYIVMELLEGETLEQRLHRVKRFTPTEAQRIVRQVATSLGSAHERGITHRDIKPDNIFLVKDAEVLGGERAKLVDFGIAKMPGEHSGHTNASAVIGTPAYMSPEQCIGAGHVDQRADIYALGCVWFALLVGHPPFMGRGSGDVIAMHLMKEPTVPSSEVSGIPRDVEALIMRCLAKEPGERPKNGNELAKAIAALEKLPDNRELLTTTPIRSSKPPPVAAIAAMTTLSAATGVSQPASMRRRGIIGAAIAIAVGVTAALVTRSGRPSQETVAQRQVVTDAAIEVAIDAAPPPPPRDATVAVVVVADASAGSGEPIPARGLEAVRPTVKQPGTLKLTSQPPCEITIDGKRLGFTTPRSIKLAPGRHRVTLVNTNAAIESSFTVEIGSEQTRVVTKHFAATGAETINPFEK
jgi:eukaryotic-like serine/threonine-protein kinase